MKQVIIVREDLKLSVGKMGAQIAHASITPILKHPEKREQVMEWFDDGKMQKKIVLGVKSVNKLLNMHDKISDAGIPCYVIRDAGFTEIEPGTVTALGVLPVHEDEINPLTKRLSVYKGCV